MSQFGTYLLLFGLAVSGYGLVAAAAGAKTGRPALVESARRCAFGLFATVAAGYTLTLATLAAYRWHLAVRARRARRYVAAATGRARGLRRRP